MVNDTGITDKDLMVYLVAKGFVVKDVKKDKNRSIVFFENTRELKGELVKFVNKENSVNIADFLAAERRIKTILCINCR